MIARLSPHLLGRLHQHAHEWRLEIEESFETETSLISFVSRQGQSLVLKMVKQPGDEWNAGKVLSTFDGKGVVRVYEHTAGAMLLERLRPGTPLSSINDDEAVTEILARVIKEMSPDEASPSCPSVADWGRGFARYLTTRDKQIP